MKQLKYTYFYLFFLLSFIGMAMISGCAKASNNSIGNTEMMTIALSADQKIYAPGDTILVKVMFTNNGPSAIDIANFTEVNHQSFLFELTYPDQKETSFSFFGPIETASQLGASVVSVPSNGKYWGGLDVSRVAGIDLPGKYSMVARLNIGDQVVTSEPFVFELESAQVGPISISAGLSIRGSTSDGRVAYVQKGARGSTIYSFEFYETLHVGEVATRAQTPFYSTEDRVEELIVPENDGNVLGELSTWLVWRNKNTVNAMVDFVDKPFQWEAPVELSGIVNGVTKVFDGPLEIMAVSEALDKLWLLQAKGGFGQLQSTLSLSWEAAINIPPSTFVMAVPPQGGIGKHHLLAIENKGESYVLRHALYDEKSLNNFTVFHVQDGGHFAKVETSIKIDESSNLLVASLQRKRTDKGSEVALNVIRFSQNGKIETLRNDILQGMKPEEVETGIFAWSRVGSKVDRLDLVIQRSDGVLLKLAGETMVPVAVQGTALTPLKLFSATESTYIIYQTEGRGFYFEPI